MGAGLIFLSGEESRGTSTVLQYLNPLSISRDFPGGRPLVVSTIISARDIVQCARRAVEAQVFMKQQANGQRTVQSPTPPRGRRDLDPVGLATLAGVVAVLMISFSNMRDIDRLDRSLGERLGKLEGQVARAPAQAAPARGPDPERVYAIRLVADAPARGPASAPVTIAEFSDFQ
jgi:hypothetical protein